MTSRFLNRSQSRRSFVKGTAAAAAGAAAWAGYLRDTSVIAAQASGEVRLTGGAASPEEGLLRQVLDDFAAKFPDITVKYEPITANYLDKLQTDMAAGNAPTCSIVKNEFARTSCRAACCCRSTTTWRRTASSLATSMRTW